MVYATSLNKMAQRNRIQQEKQWFQRGSLRYIIRNWESIGNAAISHKVMTTMVIRPLEGPT